MNTSDLKQISALEKITLATSALPGRMERPGRSMKRPPRRIPGRFGGENAGGQGCHVMSRTAGGEKLPDEPGELQALRELRVNPVA